MIIEGSHVHQHIGMVRLVDLHAFRRRDECEKKDVLGGNAAILQHLDSVGSRIAGPDHRVAQNEEPPFDLRQPDDVLDRPVTLVSIQTGVAYAGGGNQLQQALGHDDTGAQNGHDGELFTGNDGGLHLHERCFDGARGQRETAAHFVSHQQRDLAQQLTERARRRRLVAHMRKLVLDERMIEDDQVGEAGIFSHGQTRYSQYGGVRKRSSKLCLGAEPRTAPRAVWVWRAGIGGSHAASARLAAVAARTGASAWLFAREQDLFAEYRDLIVQLKDTSYAEWWGRKLSKRPVWRP